MTRMYPFEVLFDSGNENDGYRWMNLLCKSMEEVKREIETFGIDQLVYIKEYTE